MTALLLASVVLQDPDEIKMARMRAALVERFEKFEALDGRELVTLRREREQLDRACDDFVWCFENYVAAYEIMALMGKADEKVALAEEAAGEDATVSWRRCFNFLGKPRALLKDPAAAGHAGVRAVVIFASAAEGRARLAHAGSDPKRLDAVVAIAKELAPTDEELRTSEDAARVRLNAVHALARSGEVKRAAESLGAFLAIRPLQAPAAQPPKPEMLKALVARLGADSIDDRDAASRELLLLGTHAEKALEAAAKSEDAEVASRAKAVLVAIRRLTDPTTVEGRALSAVDEVFSAAKADRDALVALAALIARQHPAALRRKAPKAALREALKADARAAVEAVSAAAGRKLTAEEAADWLER